MVTIVLIEVVIFIMVSGFRPRMKSLLVVGQGGRIFKDRGSIPLLTCLDDHFSVSKDLCENTYQNDDVQGSHEGAKNRGGWWIYQQVEHYSQNNRLQSLM